MEGPRVNVLSASTRPSSQSAATYRILFVIEDHVWLRVLSGSAEIHRNTVGNGGSGARPRDIVPEDGARVAPGGQDVGIGIGDLAEWRSVEGGLDAEDLAKGLFDEGELLVELLVRQVTGVGMVPGVWRQGRRCIWEA